MLTKDGSRQDFYLIDMHVEAGRAMLAVLVLVYICMYVCVCMCIGVRVCVCVCMCPKHS